MATTKIKFRASSISGKEGTLFIQVIHKRMVRQISTRYKLFPEEWHAQGQSVILPVDTQSVRYPYLQAVQEMLRKDNTRLKLIILALDHRRKAYQAEDVIRRFLWKEPVNEFLVFAEGLVERKREEGLLSLSTKYQTSVDRFKRFLNGRLLTFEQLDASFVRSFEHYLKKQALHPNTTSFYMRNLRAIYNQAVNQGLTPQNQPFAEVFTGNDKTLKRALPVEEVQRLKSVVLSPSSIAAFSRDVFLFSLYTCGMSMIDIAHLKKSDIHDGYLTYCRQKTGQRLYIRWEPCMQQIVDRYKREDSPYLLPIITHPGQDEWRQYQNKIHLINHHLKKLGKLLELSTILTTYVARHSWASIAKCLHVPVSSISEAMGHTSERTTRIYLKLFDHSTVDDANRKVLRVIAQEKEEGIRGEIRSISW